VLGAKEIFAAAWLEASQSNAARVSKRVANIAWSVADDRVPRRFAHVPR
jgi:hypothetical protein